MKIIYSSQCLQIFNCFNPIPTEGGPFGLEQPKPVWHFNSFMAGITKIYDFVYFSTLRIRFKKLLNTKEIQFKKEFLGIKKKLAVIHDSK